jgi:two-component system, cell cycle sensor histidine kinase and response regulator CckA
MERSENHHWRSREVARLLSLLESERRYYEDILTLLPFPIAIVETSGQIASANRAFLRHFSLRAADLSLANVHRLLPTLQLTPGPQPGWELLPLARWVDENSDLILVPQTAAPATAPSVPDPALAEFSANHAATTASAKLAGRVLHEANNLLMVLSGYGEEILDALPTSSPLRDDMREILRSTERIKGMASQLQAFASPPKAVRTTFDLGPFLSGLAAREPRLSLSSELLGLSVTADRAQLEQLLLALVRYAQRPLQLETQHPATLLLHGFSRSLKEDLELLSPMARQSNGALSAVPALLAESAISWRILPAAEGSSLQLQFTAEAVATGIAKRILVVDDEDGIRTLVRKVLERHGFAVLESESGEAAIALLERDPTPIDLLISDMMMPGMGGRALSTRVNQVRPHTRTLFISGYTEDVDLQAGRLAPGTAFLAKPFQHSALLDAVNRLLA